MSGAQYASVAPASAPEVARGAFWRLLDLLSAEALTFGFTLILARLLTAADYGLVAVATTILSLAQIITRYGLGDVLVQRADLTPRMVGTALWTNVAGGTFVAVLMLLVAEPFAALLGQPELGPIVMALAWTCIPGSLAWILHNLIRRALDFRRLAIRSVAATLAGGLVGVAMALNGYGPWALVGLQVVNATVGALIFILMAQGLPRPAIDRVALRGLLRAAMPITAAATVTSIAQMVPTLAFGLALPAATVGGFFLAQRLVSSASMLTFMLAADLSLPILARLQHLAGQHRDAARRALRLAGVICLPAFTGVAALAAPLVMLLFGAGWTQSVLPLRLLACITLAMAAPVLVGQVLLSIGQRRRVVQLNVATQLPPALAACALAPFGLVPALLAQLAMAVLAVGLAAMALHRALGLGFRELLRDQAPALLAAAVMAGLLLAFELLAAGWPAAARLAAGIPLGAVAYGLVLYLLDPDFCADVLRGLRIRSVAPTEP